MILSSDAVVARSMTSIWSAACRASMIFRPAALRAAFPGFDQGEIRNSLGSLPFCSCGLVVAAVACSTSSSAMSAITPFWRFAAASRSSAVIMRRV